MADRLIRGMSHINWVTEHKGENAKSKWQKGLTRERGQSRHPEKWHLQWASRDTLLGNAECWDRWARQERPHRREIAGPVRETAAAWQNPGE